MKLVSSRPLLAEASIVHVHLSHKGSFCREGLLIALAKALGYRAFATVHGSDYVATSSHFPWRLIYTAVICRADAVAVLNEEAMVATRRMAPSTHVQVLPNPGPVPDNWVPATKPGAADRKVLFAGAVGKRKGIDVLLSAWDTVTAEVDSVELLLAGPIEDMVIPPHPTVKVLGPLSHEQVRELLGRVRVAVLPSRAEGMPMFVLEAMAAGRPVVGTTVGAMPKMLHGTGRLVATEDVRGLAEALKCYLVDPALADRDGTAGREEYLNGHSESAVVQQLAQFYRVGDPI
jgi:glycosyltransferase involved in cell wall biosynthesis